MKLDFLDPILGKLDSWVTTAIDMLPNFILALLVLLAFVLLARYVRRAVEKVLTRAYDNPQLTRLTARVARVATIIAGAMFALSIMHLDKTVTSVLAGAGIVGIALSFAFQDLAANFISGVFMAAKRPFRVGDVIEVQGYIGEVLQVNLRNTEIMTLNGNEVLIPNRLIFENPMKNFYKSKSRRVDLKVGVSYAEDLDKVERVAINAIKEGLEHLVDNEPVHVLYTEFGSSSINFEVRYWVPYDNYEQFLKGISDGIKAIKKAFDKEGIQIPFPIRTLDFGIKGGKPLEDSLDGGLKVKKSE